MESIPDNLIDLSAKAQMLISVGYKVKDLEHTYIQYDESIKFLKKGRFRGGISDKEFTSLGKSRLR